MANRQTGFAAEETPTTSPATDAIPIDQLQIRSFQLQDIPRRLPIGFVLNGERLHQFDLMPYTTEHDLILSKRNNEDLHITLGRFLPTIVRSIGGYTVPELAKELGTQPERLIQQMPFADAMAIVLNIRLETVGTDISLSDQCQRCNTKNEDSAEKGYHDLGQVDIGTLMTLNQPLVVAVELETGFQELGNTVKTVLMKPMRLFQTSDKDLRTASDERAEILMMYKMICGLPEVPEYEGVYSNLFTDSMYTRLTIADRDKLVTAARTLMKLGPKLIMGMECEACGKQWEVLIPWRFLRGFLSESARTAR